MSELRFKVLGGLEVAGGNGTSLTRKTKLVAAFLALQRGQPQSRERLADLFWENSPEEQARKNLRQCLSTLRKHLGRTLITDQDRISLDPGAVDLDAERFEKLVGGDGLEQLEQAAAIYRGDLLAGFNIKENVFEAWIRPERERYRNLMVDGLVKMLEYYEASHDTGAITKSATRLLALDPLNEAAYRILMRTYAAQGRHGAALKQFEDCRNILKRELGIEPEPETVALNRDIRRRRTHLPDDTKEKVQTPEPEVLPLPDKPSIAVLPFDNMSGDPEQEYFSDGITEDIITDLSKVAGFFVIARNSSFAYKGQSPDIRRVCRELGVRYVLEGSVRRSGQRVRINAQMIDGSTSGYVWAERYDRKLEDIFAVQDEVTRAIIDALMVELGDDERARREARRKINPEAYDHFLRGRQCLDRMSAKSLSDSRVMLMRAVELDPKLAAAYATLAIVHCAEYLNKWNDPSPNHLEQGLEFARKACKTDENEPRAYYALAHSQIWLRNFDEAEPAAQRALQLNPNFAGGLATLGLVRDYSGRHEDAVSFFERALRLDPRYGMALQYLGRSQFALERWDEAERTFNRRLVHAPRSDMTRAYLASLYGHTGRVQDAHRLWQEIMEINPNFSVDHILDVLPFKDPAWFDRYVTGLSKAGLLD